MSSLENEYNGIIAGAKEQAAAEREQFERAAGYGEPFSGVKWQFGFTHVGERPFIQVSCSECRTMFRTELLEFKWKHCGVTSVCPEELSAKLKAAQIKKGLRAKESFVERLLGKKAEPAPPALSNF